ncbi:hypothetical protein ABZ816_31245 [Actinosynnema sp. NPDC047251]|uniref:Uncharacterized protein n=1 Tax=Saccharothrix espanaensis (strain ATCC 51144 / DSM 44229 / JCM 9112 / NBRC 15066 / NRRL 15764) TaxID=1179773 RepID=K0K3G4_SACES|nr:hypothetical protein [Saccharothrix espanaensis]CCH32866.1 hypothetical protein BN6_56070 [Saccharothrix espanaensis DSM 44229]
MTLPIVVDGRDDGLWRWLSRDPALGGRIRAVPGRPPESTLGAEFVLIAAVTVVPTLVKAILAYLAERERGRAVKLRLTVKEADGSQRTVELTGQSDAVVVTRLMLDGGTGHRIEATED